MSVFPNARATSQWKIQFPKDPDEFLFMILHTGKVQAENISTLIAGELDNLLSGDTNKPTKRNKPLTLTTA